MIRSRIGGGAQAGERLTQGMGLLLVCRLILAGAVVVAGRTFLEQGSTSLILIYVAAAVLALTVLYMYVLRESYPELPLLSMQIGADLAVVTWVVSITGRGESPFVLLYFVSIILAGYFTLIRGGVAAAAAASAGYLAASLGPSLLGREAAGSPQVFQAGVNVAFFFVVGALSGYLGRNTRAQELRLERTRRELRKVQLDTDCIVRSLGSGLLTIDSQERVVLFNPAACAILQVTAERVKGEELRALDGMGIGPLSALIHETLARGVEMPRREVDVSLADGRTVPLGVGTSVVRDEGGNVTGAVAVFQDLTEVKEMEQRARSNETLAAIGQLASGVAHEIRNCLSPISGSVEVLAGDLKVDGENRQLLDLIHRESKHLEQFISSLLDFARVKPMSLAEVDLGGLIEDALESVRRHPSFKHELCFEMPETDWPGVIIADREQLRQAFLNLGINAVEATPEGGSIQVLVEYHGSTASGRSGSVAVEFSDSGRGIEAEAQERVFEPFFTTKRKGSGLGLAVVKQIVERHGGGVSLRSVAGEGTTVRLELPCHALELLRAA
jgi:two-component system sensor histidine kinase PilS (NtrC family)